MSVKVLSMGTKCFQGLCYGQLLWKQTVAWNGGNGDVHQTAIMPLIIDGRFHRQATAHEKAPVAPGVAGAVDVGLVLVLDHVRYRHRRLDLVEGSGVRAFLTVAGEP